MAQSTQIFISYIPILDEHDLGNFDKQKTTFNNHVYHLQFGFGKQMPMAIMAMVNILFNNYIFNRFNLNANNRINHFFALCPNIINGFDISSDFSTKSLRILSENQLENIASGTIIKENQIFDIVDKMSNHDGFCHFIIEEQKDLNNDYEFHYQFKLKFYDKNKKAIKAINYMSCYPDFCDETFIAMFDNFMQYFEIQELE